MTRPLALPAPLVAAATLAIHLGGSASPPDPVRAASRPRADTAAVDTAEVGRRCRALGTDSGRAPGNMPSVVPDTAGYRMPRHTPADAGDRMPNAALMPPRAGRPTVGLPDGRTVPCPPVGARRP